MKKIVSVIMVMSMAFVSSGCCSIIHGNTEKVRFTSTPDGASLKVAGIETKTPAEITLKRNGKNTAEFKMDGYQDQNVKVEESVSGWVFGNIIFGGIIGLVIDMVNGSVGDLPDEVHADMVPVDVTKESSQTN